MIFKQIKVEHVCVYVYICIYTHRWHLLLTLGMHAQRGLQYLVCACVRLFV